ncbi:MAG: PAS domain S-box protein, partial [Burkholderiaceae bacterium]|nr:PAS domain S-box protein [Burkholderiaceae bacterium]
MTPPATAADRAAAPTSLADPELRLRWALRATLLILALVLSAAGWFTWQGEVRRADDAELLNLAGAQRMLSQRIALYAVHASPGDGEIVRSAIDRAQREALRIEALLGVDDAQRLAELPGTLTQAMRSWKQAREQLWNRAHDARVTLPLLDDAETALEAAQTLAAEIQRHVDDKAAAARQRLALLAALGAASLLALGVGVLEPAARLVRQQQARAARQAAQLERMALVAERTHNLVVITDASRRIVWVNDAFTRVSGYTQSDAFGRKPAELLQTPATDPATVRQMREAMDRGQGVRVELLNRSRGGRDYWVDIDVQPLHDPQGTLTGFIAVQTDITEQVFQRQRLSTLLEAMPTGLLELNAAGAVVEANAAALQVLGLPREQLLGRTSMNASWQAVHDDLSPYPGEQQPHCRSLRDGVSVRGDSVGIMTPQGEQRWVLINSEPLRNAKGCVTGAVACFIDVTEQRAQRTLLQLALQAADIGTWQWRVDNNERQWSAESCAMLGFTAEEFQPLLPTWRERMHPEDRPQVEARLHAHLLDPSTPYRCDLRVRHRAGHWVWMQVFGSVVERDAAGKPVRMVGVQIDISERKRHEQQLKANALTDALTGLPNRPALMHRIEAAIERRRTDPLHHFAVM